MSDQARDLLKKLQGGLEELLAPGAKLYFENIFSTRHIGRVIDFLLFEATPFLSKSANPGWSEYRVRQALQLAVFCGWRAYMKAEKAKCLEIEFGWDEQKLMFSLSFIAEKGEAPGSKNDSVLERMVRSIQTVSDGTLVRHEPKTSRIQLVAFFDAAAAEEKDGAETDFVEFEYKPSNRRDGVAPDSLAKGDLASFSDEEKKTDSSASKVTTGKTDALEAVTVVPEMKSIGNDDVWLSKATPQAELEKTVISQREEEDSDLVKVSGKAAVKDDGAVRIAGGGEGAEADLQKVKRIPGSGAKDLGGLPTSFLDQATGNAAELQGPIDPVTGQVVEGDSDALGGIAEQIAGSIDAKEAEESVQILLNTVKSEMVPLCTNLSDVQFQEAFRALSEKIRENFNQTLHHLLRVKNIQTIAKVKFYKDQITRLSEKVDELKSENKELLEEVAQKDSTEAEILKLKESADPAAYQNARNKEDQKIREQLMKYQAAIDKNEVGGGAQQWAKGMLETVMKERASVNQRMKDADAFLRKRDHEFKVKESGLKQTLRMKEELLRQKDFSLSKTKETLATTLASLEKARSSGGAGNDAQKLATTEKLLQSSKDNAERLQARAQELQKKWQDEFASRASVQAELSKYRRQAEDLARKLHDATAAKPSGPSVADLEVERDKALKIIDELRRQNRQLQTRLTQTTAAAKSTATAQESVKRTNTTSDAETKHKLDHANKMVKAMKEEVDRSRKKFEELKLEETKLRVEVGRLQAQLKTAGKPAVATAGAKPVASTASAAGKPAAKPLGIPSNRGKPSK